MQEHKGYFIVSKHIKDVVIIKEDVDGENDWFYLNKAFHEWPHLVSCWNATKEKYFEYVKNKNVALIIVNAFCPAVAKSPVLCPMLPESCCTLSVTMGLEGFKLLTKFILCMAYLPAT